jgi:hypothetical protein
MRGSRILVLLGVVVTIVSSAPRSAHADSLPRDTVRAGRCSTAEIEQPDSTAQWVRVSRQWSQETPGAWSNASLRNELLALGKADQDAREGITPEKMEDTAFERRLMRGDSVRSARMNSILDRYGWPGKSMVGVRGEAAAFLLVQHSAALGPKGLSLMQAAKPGEVSRADLALVIDRQRTSMGQPQIYGSQLDLRQPAVMRFFAIEDPAHVDERRATMGLPPLRPYACMVATMYRTAVVMPDTTGR